LSQKGKKSSGAKTLSLKPIKAHDTKEKAKVPQKSLVISGAEIDTELPDPTAEHKDPIEMNAEALAYSMAIENTDPTSAP